MEKVVVRAEVVAEAKEEDGAALEEEVAVEAVAPEEVEVEAEEEDVAEPEEEVVVEAVTPGEVGVEAESRKVKVGSGEYGAGGRSARAARGAARWRAK
jgi:hypothetical protein